MIQSSADYPNILCITVAWYLIRLRLVPCRHIYRYCIAAKPWVDAMREHNSTMLDTYLRWDVTTQVTLARP